jgi:hypothetical protein
MSSPTTRKPAYPSLFLRLLLSHLVLLGSTFLAAVFLFLQLFAPGVKMFLVRTPTLLVPVILFLLLLALMLSSWTANLIARQLELLFQRISQPARPDASPTASRHGRLQEFESFAQRWFDESPAPSRSEDSFTAPAEAETMYVTIDSELRILRVLNAPGWFEAAVNPGETPFCTLFCLESYRDSMGARMRLLLDKDHRLVDLVTRSADRVIVWNSVPGALELTGELHVIGEVLPKG